MSATILGCREKQFEFVLSENKMSNNIYFKNKKFIENFYKLLENKIISQSHTKMRCVFTKDKFNSFNI